MRMIDADALIEFCAERWIPLNIDAVNMQPTIQPVATDTNVGDTISRQWLMECVNEGWIKFDTDKDANRFIHLVRDIAPSAQPEPQWIPVSERVPEESGYYIATIHFPLNGVGRRTTFVKYQKKAKSWELTGARSFWRVIAWMPLPEAYKPNK